MERTDCLCANMAKGFLNAGWLQPVNEKESLAKPKMVVICDSISYYTDLRIFSSFEPEQIITM